MFYIIIQKLFKRKNDLSKFYKMFLIPKWNLSFNFLFNKKYLKWVSGFETQNWFQEHSNKLHGDFLLHCWNEKAMKLELALLKTDRAEPNIDQIMLAYQTSCWTETKSGFQCLVWPTNSSETQHSMHRLYFYISYLLEVNR